MTELNIFSNKQIHLILCKEDKSECMVCPVIPQFRDFLPLMITEIINDLTAIPQSELVREKINIAMFVMETLGQEFKKEVYPHWHTLARYCDITDPEEILAKWDAEARPIDINIADWEKSFSEQIELVELRAGSPLSLTYLDKVEKTLDILEDISTKGGESKTGLIRLHLLSTQIIFQLLDCCSVFKGHEEHEDRAKELFFRVISFMGPNIEPNMMWNAALTTGIMVEPLNLDEK